jgi:uncharacterized protein
MLKPRGAICNLDCEYCFYLAKEMLYPGSRSRMAENLLEEYTRQYIEAQQIPEVTFAWQGGEPTLMGVDFYRKAVAFQKKYRKPGTIIHNAFQTNGTNLNDEWGQFFRNHNFLIGISLDGPRELHDAYRVDKGGRPTFDKVMAGVEILKKYDVEFNTLTCVHSANERHPLEVYNFLRDEVGSRFLQFIPIVERDNDTGFQQGSRVTSRSVNGRQYGQFLIDIFDQWVLHDVGQVFVQIFDVALGVWHGQQAGLCIFGETCGLALAMEHNGDVYSCDHYVEPDFFLGNIQENHLLKLVSSDQQRRFGMQKLTSLPRYCHECEVRFVCNGGCPKNRICKTADGKPGLNYLCEGYKAFFMHIDKPMKYMSALLRMHRPPAEVMQILSRENFPDREKPFHLSTRRKRRRNKN